MTDPLMVCSIEFAVKDAIDMAKWQQQYGRDRNDSFALDISPDIYHKARTSGGSPYQIRVPDRRIDGPLLHVIDVRGRVFAEQTFVSYLRRSFEWAGFPGCAFYDYPEMHRLQPLFAELLPI